MLRAEIDPRGKETFVRRLFDGIALRYDLMNMVMTGGVWRWWQRAFRRLNGVRPGDRVLDVGCGTADLCLIMAGQVGETGRVTGVDISPEMLAVGRSKVARSRHAERVVLLEGNALDLPFPDGSFDVVTSGFVMRNVADLGRALAEMVRVVRPGGRVVIMELSHPRCPLVRLPFSVYFRWVVPLLGWWAARRVPGPVAPYAWLPMSLRSFPDADGLADLMARAGLTGVGYRPLTGGIACLHWGTRPPAPGHQPHK